MIRYVIKCTVLTESPIEPSLVPLFPPPRAEIKLALHRNRKIAVQPHNENAVRVRDTRGQFWCNARRTSGFMFRSTVDAPRAEFRAGAQAADACAKWSVNVRFRACQIHCHSGRQRQSGAGVALGRRWPDVPRLIFGVRQASRKVSLVR